MDQGGIYGTDLWHCGFGHDSGLALTVLIVLASTKVDGHDTGVCVLARVISVGVENRDVVNLETVTVMCTVDFEVLRTS